MTRASVVRLGLLIVAVVVIQIALVSKVVIYGVHPEIVWLLPLTAGLLAGPEAGAAVGFSSGLLLDCLLPTPLGLTALVATMVGFGAGLLADQGVVVGAGQIWWVTPTIGGLGTLLSVTLYAYLGWLFGYTSFLHVDVAVLAPLVTVVGAALAIPIAMSMSWSLGADRPRRSRSSRVAW